LYPDFPRAALQLYQDLAREALPCIFLFPEFLIKSLNEYCSGISKQPCLKNIYAKAISIFILHDSLWLK